MPKYTIYDLDTGEIRANGSIGPNDPTDVVQHANADVLWDVLGDWHTERVDLATLEIVPLDPIALTVEPNPVVSPGTVTMTIDSDVNLVVQDEVDAIIGPIFLSAGVHTLNIPGPGTWQIFAEAPLRISARVVLEAT